MNIAIILARGGSKRIPRKNIKSGYVVEGFMRDQITLAGRRTGYFGL